MKRFPDTPALSEAPELTGHLWIQVLPTGLPLRFQVENTGLLRFGDEERVYESQEDLPLPYRAAAAEVIRSLDRGALESATGETSELTFFGVATVNRGVDYSWSDVPKFLGVDVYSESREGYLPPDAASSGFRRLDVATPPVLEQEVDSRYADLDSYLTDQPPNLKEYNGAAAKVLLRDKSEGRGEVEYDISEGGGEEDRAEVEDMVDGYMTEEQVMSVASEAGVEGQVSVDTVVEVAVNDLVRRRYSTLYSGGDLLVEERELRSLIAEKVARQMRLD